MRSDREAFLANVNLTRYRGQPQGHYESFFQRANHRSFDYFNWRFASKTAQVEVDGTLSAPASAFVGLTYANPPGGTKCCLNTKIAAGRLQIRDRSRAVTETLETRQRAAFEILTDDSNHGISMLA